MTPTDVANPTLPGRTEFETRLQKKRNVFLEGALIESIIDHPAFSGATKHISGFYDLQTADPQTHVTTSPDGSLGAASFLIPTSVADLQKKARSYKAVADLSFGMLGRTPDFMNSALTTMAAHSHVLGSSKYTDFSENIRKYKDFCSRNNLFIGHAAINPQSDRSKGLGQQDTDYAGVRAKSIGSDGVVFSGSKMIVTLAPINDELVVFNMPGLLAEDFKYAVAFAIPLSHEGLRVVCRKPISHNANRDDYPISSRFDEIDAYLILKDAFVPWDRIFVLEDVEKSNDFYDKTYARFHTGHQGIVRGIAKSELLVGVALSVARELRITNNLHVQEALGELTTYLEIARSLVLMSEVGGTMSESGVFTPRISAIQATRYNFPKMFRRMTEVIKSFCASSMLSAPSIQEFQGPLGPWLQESLSSLSLDGYSRTKLLNLAWDVSGTESAQRQVVYEFNHAGDPVRIGAAHYKNYETRPLELCVQRALES